MTTMPRFAIAAAAGTAMSLLLAGCGGEGGHGHGGGHGAASSHSKSTAVVHKPSAKPTGPDAEDLLDLIDAGHRQNASRYAEVEIGKFKVTHKVGGERRTLVVSFRVFAVVPDGKVEHLHHELKLFEKRVRDAVISLVQKTDAEQLAEPGLNWLKAELVAAINRVLQERIVQDVAFSEFSMESV